MVKAIQFDTKNQSFRQIMGNGLRYQVPRFQRNYSWDEEQWEELWQDISEQNSPEQHYMGYLVLQSTDNKNFVVIDGQQRLTTISLIVLATLYELQALAQGGREQELNQKRLETLKNSFIGFTDPVTLEQQNKLVLNRNNDDYFSTYLCELLTPAERNISQSNHLIRKALVKFRNKLNGREGKELAQFIERIADLLLFTTITVGEDTNAYVIFETLNARGVKLSTPDLVKNYIFSIIDKKHNLHDSSIETLDRQWANIVDQLGRNKFSDFIRVDWNSRNELARGKNLFQKIKAEVTNNQKARTYLQILQNNSQVYSSLKNENDEFWKIHKEGVYLVNNDLSFRLKTLRLFGVVAPLNALLAAFERFIPSDFIRFLGFIETISVRYNFICSMPTNEQNRVYSEVARLITNQKDVTPTKTLGILKKVYPSDEHFFLSFGEKNLRTAQSDKKARYLIYRIEKHLNRNCGNFEELTLEHILPKNYDQKWQNQFEETTQIDSLVSRIGNMTLLDRKQNQSLGNKNFSEKKEIFKKSSFQVTKNCCEYQSWNEASITRRQKWLGNQAKSLWHIPGIS